MDDTATPLSSPPPRRIRLDVVPRGGVGRTAVFANLRSLGHRRSGDI